MYEAMIDQFRKTFAPLKGRKIALYGAGKLSRAILHHCTDFDIAGVLDGNTEKQEFCGKPVIPIEQAGRWEIESVIIIARKSSAMIIRNRIIDACRKCRIQVFDLYGRDPGIFTDNISAADIQKRGGSLADKIVIDLFSQAFHVWKDKKTARQFGYTFAAPMIASFCISLLNHIEANRYDSVWLLSRDGYLIKKCLEHLRPCVRRETQFLYLLTSRVVLTDKDSRYSYVKYLRKQKPGGKTILIVDFVAAGTCQERLEMLLGRHFEGYYFVRVGREDKAGLDISSFYSVSEYTDDTSALYTLYPLLELLVSSTEPSLAGFDEKNGPVYSNYSMASEIAEDIAQAQEGILDYLKDYIGRNGQWNTLPDWKLCDDILRVGSKEELKDIPFLQYEYYDEFYQRKYFLPLPENGSGLTEPQTDEIDIEAHPKNTANR